VGTGKAAGRVGAGRAGWPTSTRRGRAGAPDGAGGVAKSSGGGAEPGSWREDEAFIGEARSRAAQRRPGQYRGATLRPSNGRVRCRFLLIELGTPPVATDTSGYNL